MSFSSVECVVCLQDLDSLQLQLEEVRFFDLFGYSEEEGGWLCFMCNNPEKATGNTHTHTLTLLCVSDGLSTDSSAQD